MAKKRMMKAKQGTFFPLPDEPEPRREARTHYFDDHEVRTHFIKGQLWFVAADICRALDIGNAPMAVSRLDDDERMTISTIDSHSDRGRGGAQSLNLINQFGVNSLILTSRKPDAKRIKRWITHDVIPAIQRDGFYSLPSSRASRVNKTARRLGMDMETARLRCDQVDINKASHGRLAEDGASRRDFQAWHNAGYRAQFHMDAPDLRKAIGLPPSRSPLDQMDQVVMAPNLHAKTLADRLIREAKAAGRPIPLEAQPAILHEILSKFAADDLRRLGPEYTYGVRDDARRGKVIDAMKRQLVSA